MKLEPFAVEAWMDDHETRAKHNIAESCCSSLSVAGLLELSSMQIDPLTLLDVNAKQDYGDIRGISSLRSNLAGLYSVKKSLPADNILVTPGAIAANAMVLYSLIGPGDHVVCHYPTYQQLYSLPKSLGAKVDLWKAKSEKKWEPDFDELKSMLKDNTKLIILNNPNNPTGAVLKKSLLHQIVDLAQERGITIFSDEVYRPIFHSIGPMDDEFPPSLMSLSYDKVICTGSMSKAYALAGIRIGWIASRSKDLIEQCAGTRHYTTISVSRLDQQIAAFALSSMALHSLLGRNTKLAKENLAVLEKFVDEHREFCDWARPVAGTTAFVRFSRSGKPVNSIELCEALLDKAGVLFVPGECFGDDFRGYVRIGFVAEASVVRDGLQAVSNFLRSDFSNVPVA